MICFANMAHGGLICHNIQVYMYIYSNKLLLYDSIEELLNNMGYSL